MKPIGRTLRDYRHSRKGWLQAELREGNEGDYVALLYLAHLLRNIDQAVGIMRSRSGISTDAALARLRQHSEHEHIKVKAVAASIVHEAVRRAQARRGPTTG